MTTMKRGLRRKNRGAGEGEKRKIVFAVDSMIGIEATADSTMEASSNGLRWENDALWLAVNLALVTFAETGTDS